MDRSKIALVSMPWMSTSFPSIQLAVLAKALGNHGLDCDRFELFLDFAARIGPRAYSVVSGSDSLCGESVFARCYWGEESVSTPQSLGSFVSVENAEAFWDAIYLVANNYLDDLVEQIEWDRYDIIGFSLTIAQTTASMALAKRIKEKFPGKTIVVGGTSCAGPMGVALLRACPEFDYAVSVEGEEILPRLVDAIRTGGVELAAFSGVSARVSRETNLPLHSKPNGTLRQPSMRGIDFDPFFQRLSALGLHDKINVWLPIETSRGCWFGEKSQCKFCGLHEIMKYRTPDRDEDLVSILTGLQKKYGIDRFFSVDLIMPQQFYNGVLETIAKEGKSWNFFYEIKANVTMNQVQMLASAGVKWIQPGIESLSRRSLQLMSKGSEPYHNIQVLKWCKDLAIRVSWNIIYGLPGEVDEDVFETIRKAKMLFHLEPPSGAGRFQLHRFSPYFDMSKEYGISRVRPRAQATEVIPVADDVLFDMSYQFEFDISSDCISLECETALQAVIAEWRKTYSDGAFLNAEFEPSGAGRILDGRVLGGTVEYELDSVESQIIRLTESAVLERDLLSQIARGESAEGVKIVLSKLEQQGFIIREAGRVIGLVNMSSSNNSADLLKVSLAAHASLVSSDAH